MYNTNNIHVIHGSIRSIGSTAYLVSGKPPSGGGGASSCVIWPRTLTLSLAFLSYTHAHRTNQPSIHHQEGLEVELNRSHPVQPFMSSCSAAAAAVSYSCCSRGSSTPFSCCSRAAEHVTPNHIVVICCCCYYSLSVQRRTI